MRSKLLIGMTSIMFICLRAYGSELLPWSNNVGEGYSPEIDHPVSISTDEREPSPSQDMANIANQDIVMGNPQAKVVIIEYSSPTCPHCYVYHRTLFMQIKKKYIETGKIAYVMREAIAHKLDIPAATLMRCGARREPLMHAKILDAIFELQQKHRWSVNYQFFKSELVKIGEIAGISAEEYQNCLEDKEIQNELLWHRKLLDGYESVWGTPMFFINGRRAIVNLDKEISKALDQQS